ncbi:MAG: BlaI/MecI/CopY family transcriptional regulator [Oscillospiraceae bacterium]
MDEKIRLSDSEWKIISELWSESPRTITQLVSALKQSCNWSKSTVITLLNRMEAKGAVYYTEGRKARMYFPSATHEELVRSETEEFIDKVYNGNAGLLLSALVDSHSLSADEISSLHSILSNAQKEKEEKK